MSDNKPKNTSSSKMEKRERALKVGQEFGHDLISSNEESENNKLSKTGRDGKLRTLKEISSDEYKKSAKNKPAIKAANTIQEISQENTDILAQILEDQKQMTLVNQHEVEQAGIGCSDKTIFNILNRGERVTRGKIKKEEDVPLGEDTGFKKYIQPSEILRNHYELQQIQMHHQKEVQKLLKRQMKQQEKSGKEPQNSKTNKKFSSSQGDVKSQSQIMSEISAPGEKDINKNQEKKNKESISTKTKLTKRDTQKKILTKERSIDSRDFSEGDMDIDQDFKPENRQSTPDRKVYKKSKTFGKSKKSHDNSPNSAPKKQEEKSSKKGQFSQIEKDDPKSYKVSKNALIQKQLGSKHSKMERLKQAEEKHKGDKLKQISRSSTPGQTHKNSLQFSILQRHLEMIDRFEQHFPHFKYLNKRFILYDESFAQVVSNAKSFLPPSRIQSQIAQSQSSFDGVAQQVEDYVKNSIDYDNLQASVQIYPDSPSIDMPIKHFKFLCGLFICSLSLINTEDLSDEIQSCLDNQAPDSQVVLVQVIDNSNKYDNQRSPYSSTFPMTFYLVAKDVFDDRVILGGPVDFKNLISETELVNLKFMRDQLKQSSKELREFDSRLQVTFDYLRDLTPLSDNIKNNIQLQKWGYKADYVEFILDQAIVLNDNFKQYLNNVAKITVTERNIQEALFTQCAWSNQHRGILLQARFDQESKSFMLLLRLIHVNQNQEEKLKWVPIMTKIPNTNQYQYQVSSKLHRGHVSIDFLTNLNNQFHSGLKLRTRHLVFQSHEAFLKQARVFINPFCYFDAKITRSICQVHNQWDALISSQSSINDQINLKDPFSNCSRSLNGDGFNITCSGCQKNFENVKWQKIPLTEKLWRCDECVRCTFCYSQIGNESQLLKCSDCFTFVHFDCLEPHFKQVLPNQLRKIGESQNITNKNKALSFKDEIFKCQFCVKCEKCGKRSTDKGWSDDFQLCKECEKKDITELQKPSETQADTVTIDQKQSKQPQIPPIPQTQTLTDKNQEIVHNEQQKVLSDKIKTESEDSSPLELGKRMHNQRHLGRGHESPELKKSVNIEGSLDHHLKNHSLLEKEEQHPQPAKRQKNDDQSEQMQCSDDLMKIERQIHKKIEVFSAAAERTQTSNEIAKRQGGNKFEKHSVASGKASVSVASASHYNHLTASSWLNDKPRRKMIEQYQQEDDEGCYYSNPIRCSFDDPSLIFEEMCYLCGAFGNQEELLTCILCGESFHTYCLQLSSNDIDCMFQSNWKCLNCKSCEKCGKATDEDMLNFCGYCDRPFHSYCLDPEIKNIPEHWKCEICFQCKSCGTKKFYDDKSVEKGINLINSDYSLSQNFELCFNCGVNKKRMEKCCICEEVTSIDQYKNLEILKCNCCEYYSHLKCSRLTLPQLVQHFKDVNSQRQEKLQSVEQVYTCLDCLVEKRSINYLVYEACQHYENIHNLVQRHQLLANLCFEILANYFPNHLQDKAPMFIKKFIFQNQNFFKHDEVLRKWLELMETEVYYDATDYGIKPQIISQNPSNMVVDQSREVQQSGTQIKGNWKGFNPFSQSDYVKKIEAESLSTLNIESLISSGNQFDQYIDSLIVSKKVIPEGKDNQLSDAQMKSLRVDFEMNGFKQGFLPQKRGLWSSMIRGDLNKCTLTNSVENGQSMYLSPEEIQGQLYNTQQKKEQLVQRLVSGIGMDDELSSEFSSSNESDNISQRQDHPHSLAQAYVDYELRSVMRIKLHFFKWFEDFFKKTKDLFLGNVNNLSDVDQMHEEKELVRSHSVQLQYQVDRDIPIKLNSDQISSQIEDLQIQNPQLRLTCLLCKQRGEFSITGRLIPYKLQMYVHVNCALWTEQVFEIDDGQIINFYHLQQKIISQKCSLCQEYGAGISCSRKNCQRHYHFPCAYKSGKIVFTKNKEVFCDFCNKKGNEADIGPVCMPSDFMKKKRHYLVKNFELLSEQDYKAIQHRESLKEKTPSKNGQNFLREKASREDRKKQKKAEITSPTKVGDEEGSFKEVQVDKWRPFYFDLFNRVGNLTVLSLRKEVNQIVDLLKTDTQTTGLNFVQQYLHQKYRDENSQFEISQPNMSSPYPNRYQVTQTGGINKSGTSLMEELKNHLDLINDFAAVRIFWKFYDDKQMTIPAKDGKDPRKLKRTYLLFINKSKQIFELEKNDLKTVLEFCSQQIKENRFVQENASQFLSEHPVPSNFQINQLISQDTFWQQTMSHFFKQRPDFCLQNIEFCIEKLFGLAKYPINVWNQLELKLSELKLMNTQKSKLSFFLKSALDIMSQPHYNHPGFGKYCLLNPSLSKGLQNLTQRDKIDVNASTNVLKGRVLTLEGVFQRMIQVNNMDIYDHDRLVDSNSSVLEMKRFGTKLGGGAGLNQMDQFSINNLGTKHMSYNEIQIALGKGRKVLIEKVLNEIKQRRNSQEGIQQVRHKKKQLAEQKNQFQQAQQHSRQNEMQQQQMAELNQSDSKAFKVNLPLAMLYRQAILNPKRLEVGQSKIHRIGLFTLENLKPHDILIEYVGEVIKNEESDSREQMYKEKGIGDCYMFRLDDNYVIDATFYGNKARYLNHSCNANCYAEPLTINSDQHIIIRAKRHIMSGEELTYNYQFGEDEDKLRCYCGAQNCSGEF